MVCPPAAIAAHKKVSLTKFNLYNRQNINQKYGLENLKYLLLTSSLILIVFIGCGHKPELIFDQPTIPTEGYYEKAWVDPEIIISDSLFTLIRSERVDSFYIDKPLSEKLSPGESFEFKIDRQFCLTSINLIRSDGLLIGTLWERNLTFGFYKVNVNPTRLDKTLFVNEELYLQVQYCDNMISKPMDR